MATMAALAIPNQVTQAQTAQNSLATAIATRTPAPIVVVADNSRVVLPAVKETLTLKITAYASTPDETKSYGSPFITANGTYVHDGVVATNILPFGTKVMIPSLFGNQIFTVDDRMSRKLMDNMDIWMPTVGAALVFGIHTADVEVLADDSDTGTSGQQTALLE